MRLLGLKQDRLAKCRDRAPRNDMQSCVVSHNVPLPLAKRAIDAIVHFDQFFCPGTETHRSIALSYAGNSIVR
jgi:hypothetical protein